MNMAETKGYSKPQKVKLKQKFVVLTDSDLSYEVEKKKQ